MAEGIFIAAVENRRGRPKRVFQPVPTPPPPPGPPRAPPGAAGPMRAPLCRPPRATRRYVALYHLVSPEIQATPAWKSAADTEWTRKLRPHFRDHLRLVCKKYVREG